MSDSDSPQSPPPSYAPRARMDPPRKRSGERSPKRRTWKKMRSALAILVVMVTSGVVFGVAASNTRGQASSSDVNLLSMVRDRQETVQELTDQRNSLRESIHRYVGTTSSSDDPATNEGAASSIPIGTTTAVQGPGVTVTLTDAPADQILPEGAQPDDLVIHQQDIEDVMNALWRGGAEAMTVQGKRVTSRSVIRCIGNVILVDGTSYSPPYAISAIGDPDRLKRAINSDERIINYKRYVVKYGLGWRLDEEKDLTFTALPEDTSPQYARIVEDHG